MVGPDLKKALTFSKIMLRVPDGQTNSIMWQEEDAVNRPNCSWDDPSTAGAGVDHSLILSPVFTLRGVLSKYLVTGTLWVRRPPEPRPVQRHVVDTSAVSTRIRTRRGTSICHERETISVDSSIKSWGDNIQKVFWNPKSGWWNSVDTLQETHHRGPSTKGHSGTATEIQKYQLCWKLYRL